MLTLMYDGIEVRAGRDLQFRMSSACGDDAGGMDAALPRIPFALLRQIISARNIEIPALGFHVRLTDSDLRPLLSFQTAVTNGVTVRWTAKGRDYRQPAVVEMCRRAPTCGARRRTAQLKLA